TVELAQRLTRLRDPAPCVGEFYAELLSRTDDVNPSLARIDESLQGLRRPRAFEIDNAEVLAGVGRLDAPIQVVRIQPGQLLRQLEVLAKGCLGGRDLAALPRDVADPVHALRMVEDALPVTRIARHQLAGAVGRTLKHPQGLVEAAALLGDLA